MQLSASKSDFPGILSTKNTLLKNIYIRIFSSYPCLCVVCFQAINKGPSRLPGSMVDIRIPNRLAGNGADMFHVIETQVETSSSLSTVHIQQESL